MGLFNQFPFTNFDRVNLDAIMAELRKLDSKVTDYLAYSTITYADPLQWNITTQYVKNTVVVDSDGTAYLSTQPVPAGIAINDTEYWTPIGNFSELWTSLKLSISAVDLGSVAISPDPLSTGDLFWLNNTLYIATADLSGGSAVIEGTNCQKISVEDLLNEIRQAVTSVSDGLADEITERQDEDSSIRNDFAAADTDIRDDMETADSALDARITVLENATSSESVSPYTVTPVLMGELSSVSQLCAACQIGDLVYTLDNNTYDSNGELRVFSITSNSKTMQKTVKIGHGNSMCYSVRDNAVYVAPMAEYDGGVSTQITKIYKFNTAFTTRTEINAPGVVYAISYDHVADKLYAFVNSGTSLTVYEVDAAGVFTQVAVLNCPEILTDAVLQDVAVKAGYAYVSTTNRIVGVYSIDSGACIKSFYVSVNDTGNVYNLGELEGMEFNASGELIAMNAFYIATRDTATGMYNPTIGIVTQIPTNKAYFNAPKTVQRQHSTMVIREDYGDVFKTGNASLKGVEYLAALIDPSCTLEITQGNISTIAPMIFVNRHMAIRIDSGCTFTINHQIAMNGCTFGLFVASGGFFVDNLSNTPTFLCSNRPNVIYISIEGTASGTGTTYNNFIQPGYFRQFISLGSLNGFPSAQIGINGVMCDQRKPYVSAIALV